MTDVRQLCNDYLTAGVFQQADYLRALMRAGTDALPTLVDEALDHYATVCRRVKRDEQALHKTSEFAVLNMLTVNGKRLARDVCAVVMSHDQGGLLELCNIVAGRDARRALLAALTLLQSADNSYGKSAVDRLDSQWRAALGQRRPRQLELTIPLMVILICALNGSENHQLAFYRISRFLKTPLLEAIDSAENMAWSVLYEEIVE